MRASGIGIGISLALLACGLGEWTDDAIADGMTEEELASKGIFLASVDTYVTSGDPDANHGRDKHLGVDRDPSKATLLRFKVSKLQPGSVARGRLKLYVTEGGKSSGSVHEVSGKWSDSVGWDERPDVGARLADLDGPAKEKTWRSATINSKVSEDGELSLYVIGASSDGVQYASREVKGKEPRFELSESAERRDGGPDCDESADPANPYPCLAASP
jgi:hypothetical protein